MIAFNRIGKIAPGKTAGAVAFAHEISAYMKDAYKVDLEVMMPIGGNPQRIAWSARYQDLAAFDAVSAKLLGDQRYWAIVAKATDLFLPGSMQDSMWRVV